jgi:hypothetical protein
MVRILEHINVFFDIRSLQRFKDDESFSSQDYGNNTILNTFGIYNTIFVKSKDTQTNSTYLYLNWESI